MIQKKRDKGIPKSLMVPTAIKVRPQKQLQRENTEYPYRFK